MPIEQFLSRSASPLPPSVALAPMTGISDVALRRLAARFGATAVTTEMVPADAYLRGHEEARLRSEGFGLSPHIVQLVGRDPARLADAARLAEASGADALDINMGCPAKRVIGGLGGSGLMREPDLALQIAEAVIGAVRIPVTIKMRLGWDDATRNAPELAARAAAIGIRGFVVHGRTRQQFYAGQADWAAIAAVVEAVSVPVVANGDVCDLAGARACLAASGASGIMIGRAALGQPWLLGEVAAALAGRPHAGPGPAERAAAACEHYEALLGLYGRAIGTRHARKHLAAYADRASAVGYGLPAAERAEIVTATEPARVLRLLSGIYADRARRAA